MLPRRLSANFCGVGLKNYRSKTVIKNWLRNSEFQERHPSEEELLKCVDGELSAGQAGRVRAHLETCWTCRLELEKIEETISAFVGFRQQIQIPLTPAPPNNWNDFNRKLKEIPDALPESKKSLWSLGNYIRGRFFDSFSLLSNRPPIHKQAVIGVIATLLIAVLFWQLMAIRNVSASELLDKASQIEWEKIREVEQAVVYQKLRVRRQDESELNWEVWRDTTRARFRQNVSHEINRPFDRDLWQILQDNGFNPQQPLSAATFANWRKTLAEKSDSVEKGQTTEGVDLLILRTVNLRADSTGKIREGILKVRQNDFHPLEQTLRIITANGIETYDFTELDFQVLSLDTFHPDFFPAPVEPQLTTVVPKPSLTPAAKEKPDATPTASPGPAADRNPNTIDDKTEAPILTASVDLEVEVLDLLNQAKADLGEQITVRREADGLLYVRGIVETPIRKNEILKALQSVQNNPAVRIEIKTVDEAMAEQKNMPKPSGTAERVESQSSETASDSELLKYFNSEQAARAFGGQMITRSNRAMSRAFALKRLVGQFKPDELRQMSPAARTRFLNLVKLHARAFREESEKLRQELQPVFEAPNVNASATIEVNDIADVHRAVNFLLDFASANDGIVRSAFTISAGSAKFTAIKTTQFWQSLKNAEALATKLQAVK
jgi:hypothetical protein